jgi:hypothetical protein
MLSVEKRANCRINGFTVDQDFALVQKTKEKREKLAVEGVRSRSKKDQIKISQF